MNWLTKQEQLILCVVLGLFLLGLSVKVYRIASTTPQPVQALNSSENSGKR